MKISLDDLEWINNPEVNYYCPSCKTAIPFKAIYNEAKRAWYLKCDCGSSIELDLPEIIVALGEYPRASQITRHRDGYFEVLFQCDSDSNVYNTTADCADNCPRSGCHIFTAANDFETYLDSGDEDLDWLK